MRKITAISLSAIATFATVPMFPAPAKADFGDFLLGVGAAAGVSAISNNSRRQSEQRYRPVAPQEEYYRGVRDGTSALKYDNPRNSTDYDQGYEEGLRRSNASGTSRNQVPAKP